MKQLALLLLLTGPAHAQAVIPEVYAQSYCTLRRAGVPSQEAANAAVSRSIDYSRTRQWVTYHGERVEADLLEAVELHHRLCPKY